MFYGVSMIYKSLLRLLNTNDDFDRILYFYCLLFIYLLIFLFINSFFRFLTSLFTYLFILFLQAQNINLG
jgi:hypothetical protein